MWLEDGLKERENNLKTRRKQRKEGNEEKRMKNVPIILTLKSLSMVEEERKKEWNL